MSSYSEGQTHQFLDALEAKGWPAVYLTKLGQAKLEQHQAIRDVLDGHAVISYPKHLPEIKPIIDCDTTPFIPNGAVIVKHKKGGQFEWNPTKVRLYLSDDQESGKLIGGKKLCKELEKQPVLNARVLDYLLTHPELIPNEWKCKPVLFWGTIYRDDVALCVRHLCWSGIRWVWHFSWFNDEFDACLPAAIAA